MKTVMMRLKSMKRKYVIDIGCGGCELVRDLLKDYFWEIDMLDYADKAIDEAH